MITLPPQVPRDAIVFCHHITTFVPLFVFCYTNPRQQSTTLKQIMSKFILLWRYHQLMFYYLYTGNLCTTLD